jgi:hypothetical protein
MIYTVDIRVETCNFMDKDLQKIFSNNIITFCYTFFLLLQFNISNCFTCTVYHKTNNRIKKITVLFFIDYTFGTHIVYIYSTQFLSFLPFAFE